MNDRDHRHMSALAEIVNRVEALRRDIETTDGSAPPAVAIVRRATADVLGEVAQERVSQDEKWGGPEHDDQHALSDFVDYTAGRVKGLREADTDYMQRMYLIETAALAVAAIESFDRKAADTEVSANDVRGITAPDRLFADIFPKIRDLEKELGRHLFPGSRIERQWVVDRYAAGEPLDDVARGLRS